MNDLDERLVRASWDTTFFSQYDESVQPHRTLQLSAGELGCARSHIDAWIAIANQNLVAKNESTEFSFSCIFEDDVILVPQFLHNLQKLLYDDAFHGPFQWDLLYLGYLNYEDISMRFSSKTIYSTGLFQSHAYCITPQGANLLLSLLPVVGPIDIFLAQYGPYRKLAAHPPLAHQNTAFDSGIVHDVHVHALKEGFVAGLTSDFD